MATVDFCLYVASVVLALLLLLFSIWRVAVHRSVVNWVSLAAAVCISIKAVSQLVYLQLLWVACAPRYFLTFFFLNAAKLLLYATHERRLAVFFAARPDDTARRAGVAFRAAIYTVFSAYAANAVAQVVVNCRDCYTTSTGGLSVSSRAAATIKIVAYSSEMTLGLLLLAGNAYALNGLMRANRDAGVASSPAFTLILSSDAVRFLAVLPVEVYKLAVSGDPSGFTGVFPYGPGNGNSGFQQLLDAYKVAALLLLLHFPSAYASLKARVSSGSVGSRAMFSSSAKLSQTASQSTPRQLHPGLSSV
ncbi:hypothetical protein HK405_004831 [Cladochytrium tenue]|nr:hypothetical protein HK405_004831 [Cladochytrium tenue]